MKKVTVSASELLIRLQKETEIPPYKSAFHSFCYLPFSLHDYEIVGTCSEYSNQNAKVFQNEPYLLIYLLICLVFDRRCPFVKKEIFFTYLPIIEEIMSY